MRASGRDQLVLGDIMHQQLLLEAWTIVHIFLAAPDLQIQNPQGLGGPFSLSLSSDLGTRQWEQCSLPDSILLYLHF